MKNKTTANLRRLVRETQINLYRLHLAVEDESVRESGAERDSYNRDLGLLDSVSITLDAYDRVLYGRGN